MSLPHVVIIGGGFGGLTAARALRRLPVRVTLIDRANHHLFQPLLYQVATAMLMPGQIAAPIRHVLRRHRRTRVVLGDVTGVDTGRRQVTYAAGDAAAQRMDYDYLIVATGVRHSYFGRGEFEKFAPGLKTLGDATQVRNRILSAFEAAERESDVNVRRALLTFVVVGGGPTGVELAGAIAELARMAMKEDFRRIDTRQTRILLVEAGPRILPSFGEDMAAAAAARLRAMGVEVACGAAVEEIDSGGVRMGGAEVAGRTVLWAAGVEASAAAEWLGAPRDRAGRVRVRYDLSVPGRPEVFVIGDLAAFEQDERQLPGVAQVALQMGRHAARVIEARLLNDAPPPSFSYRDKGNLAVVGRNFAVLERGRLRLSGYPAWAVWSMIHILFLALPNMRASVFLQWVWSYVTGQRGSRLIVEQKFSSSSGRSSRSGE